MTRLTKGMYGNYLHPKDSLFDLYSGQMRGGKTKMTHNSGWYNKLGEKLDYGDLSIADFRKISRGLKKGEFFIILSETDSEWRFQYGINGQPKVNLPKEAPGVEYVAENAIYAIARKEFYLIDHYGTIKEKVYSANGLNFKIIGVDDFKKLITAD